jgi:hypothetical protein
MGADLKGQEEEGGQPPVFSHRVTWNLPVYNHRTIQEHHRAVNQEFGLPFIEGHQGAERRYMRHAESATTLYTNLYTNSYSVNYYFRDPHDAVMFSLKYVK